MPPPGVAEHPAAKRFDEQGLTASGRVVDDALDPRSRLGLDGDDVPTVAQRDDRLLERIAELGPDQRVEPPAQPVIGDADRGPQPTEAWRGGVQQLTDGVEAPRQRAPDGRQRMELAPEVAQQRATLVGERRRQTGGRVERVRDGQELLRLQTAAAGRPFDGWLDVVRAADTDSGSIGQEPTRLIRLVESARDDDGVG